MITLIDYEEIKDNLQMEFYEILEKEHNGIQVKITLDRGIIVTNLYNNEHEALHGLELEKFKAYSLEELNSYINQVWCYNRLEKP